MSTEIATGIPSEDARVDAAPRPWRVFGVQLLGPITIIAGLVWAVAQPYRLVFLDGAGRGFFNYVLEGPLLVIAVGVLFTVALAPGLVDDLGRRRRRRSDGPAR